MIFWSEENFTYICADDDGAKTRVETLLEGFGYFVIDLGNLRDGGLMQQAGGPLAAWWQGSIGFQSHKVGPAGESQEGVLR